MGPVGLSAGGDSQPQGQQEMGRRVGSQGRGGDGLLRFQDTGGRGTVLWVLGVSVFPIWEVGFVGILG